MKRSAYNFQQTAFALPEPRRDRCEQLRPFFHFFGSKWAMAKRYPKPQYNCIIEPFAGSAGYALRYADRDVILVERDPVIAGLWRWLISVDPEEVRALPLFQSGGPYELKDLEPLSEPARNLIGFWIVVATAKPGIRCGQWMRNKIESGGAKKHPENGAVVAWGDTFWSERMRERIAHQVQFIRHWRVVESSYEAFEWNEPATWFIDPPYIGPGKSYTFGARKIDYQHLGKWCDERRGQVIVCEQDGATWLPFQELGRFKSTAGKSKKNGSKEVIYLRESK